MNLEMLLLLLIVPIFGSMTTRTASHHHLNCTAYFIVPAGPTPFHTRHCSYLGSRRNSSGKHAYRPRHEAVLREHSVDGVSRDAVRFREEGERQETAVPAVCVPRGPGSSEHDHHGHYSP